MKATISYGCAAVFGLISLTFSSGIVNSISFGGMLGYAFFTVLFGAASVAMMGLGSYYEQEEWDKTQSAARDAKRRSSPDDIRKGGRSA
ncbi:MAG: hypothetical protein ACI4JC_01245 [Faecalibacterium sp.]